jgi:hypothetical protein
MTKDRLKYKLQNYNFISCFHAVKLRLSQEIQIEGACEYGAEGKI